MNTTQRYALYKMSYRDYEDPLQSHIDNLNRAINHFGNELGSSLNANMIDSYFITMIETNDKRRALLDLQDIPNAAKALEKDITKTITNDLNKMIKEINKGLK